MGYILIVAITLVGISIIGYRGIKEEKGILKRFFILIKDINIAYFQILKQDRVIKVGIDLILIVAAEIFTFIGITTATYRYFNIDFITRGEPFLKGIVSILIFIMVYHFIGYIILFASKINIFIRKTEDSTFKRDFIITYFLISTYLTIMIIFPREFNKLGYIVLVGLIISYFLNMKLIIGLMMDPTNAKSKKEEEVNFKRIIIAAILIVIMLVLNLFLAVCVIEGVNPDAYTHVDGYFSLLYYTIITFTTVGYGDIVPLTTLGRSLAVIISITSVVCITVFLSSILSYREKFK